MKTIIFILSTFLFVGCYTIGTTSRDVSVHVPIVKDTLGLHSVNQGDTVAVGEEDSSSVDLVMEGPTYDASDTTQEALETYRQKLAQAEKDKQELRRIISTNKTKAIVQVQPPDVKTQIITNTVTPGTLMMLWKLKGYILSLMLLAVLLSWLIYLFLKVKGIALNPLGLMKRIVS